jgi:hypothetical protein
VVKPTGQYWKEIPGANLYVSFDKAVTLNLRYELPDPETHRIVRDKVASITGMSDIVVELQSTPPKSISDEHPDADLEEHSTGG